jgi:hypothetical protein
MMIPNEDTKEDSFHVRNTVPSVTAIDYPPYVLGIDADDDTRMGDSSDDGGNDDGLYVGRFDIDDIHDHDRAYLVELHFAR